MHHTIIELVGSSAPKSVVLLADVLLSFGIKLVAPYSIHVILYELRVLGFAAETLGKPILSPSTSQEEV